MEQNPYIDSFLLLTIVALFYFVYNYLSKYYSPKIKGRRGENTIESLLRRLGNKEYLIYNNIYLKTDWESTQIDHLIISIYGIYIIETKNYNGWIHGSEYSEYWTQSIYKYKKKFRNPIKQNWAHIYFLKKILSITNHAAYYPIVAFVGNAKLKNIYSSLPVIYGKELLALIRRNDQQIFSNSQVEMIANQLESHIVHDKNIVNKHRHFVNRLIHERRRKIKDQICPKCEGNLMIRNGKYGKFYGCSNFPRCKFTIKI